MNNNNSMIEKLFKSLDIKEYDNSTINCMNQFINSYITNILKEAKKNMIISKREKISIEDVESAVNTKQNNMFNNRAKIHEMKFIANKVNSIDLPQIPENPVVLIPPINNNLLRNNFQIYSDELRKHLMDNKIIFDNISMKSHDIKLLGNKTKESGTNEYKNNSNNKKEQKNRRKKSINSINQEFKKSFQENYSKENKTTINDNLKNNEDQSYSDNDEEIQNDGKSNINKKEEDSMEEDEDIEEEQSEELEDDENMENNGSNNNNELNESSYTKNNNEEDNFQG